MINKWGLTQMEIDADTTWKRKFTCTRRRDSPREKGKYSQNKERGRNGRFFHTAHYFSGESKQNLAHSAHTVCFFSDSPAYLCILKCCLRSFRYASLAATWITAMKKWRSTWAPPFSIAQTTTGQRHFRRLLANLGRQRPSLAYSPSCRGQRIF